MGNSLSCIIEEEDYTAHVHLSFTCSSVWRILEQRLWKEKDNVDGDELMIIDGMEIVLRHCT